MRECVISIVIIIQIPNLIPIVIILLIQRFGEALRIHWHAHVIIHSKAIIYCIQ